MSDDDLMPAVPDRLRPPIHGFEAADLDDALFVLAGALRCSVPHDLRVRREMTVTIGRRQRPEPDLIVIKAEAERDPNQTTYEPRDVVLAIEVVSPESRERDRKRKPQLYAEAGIQHFWLVEQEDGEPVLHTYELDGLTSSYVPTGIHLGTAKIDVPYPIEIDRLQAHGTFSARPLVVAFPLRVALRSLRSSGPQVPPPARTLRDHPRRCAPQTVATLTGPRRAWGGDNGVRLRSTIGISAMPSGLCPMAPSPHAATARRWTNHCALNRD